MAALNKDETEALGKALQVIEEIQRRGFDPKLAEQQPTSLNDEVMRARTIARDLEHTRRRLHTIKTMKGYYPK